MVEDEMGTVLKELTVWWGRSLGRGIAESGSELQLRGSFVFI